MEVFHLFDPFEPTYRGGTSIFFGNPTGVRIDGDYAMVAVNYYGLYIYDIRPPLPVFVGIGSLDDQIIEGLALNGNHAFLVGGLDRKPLDIRHQRQNRSETDFNHRASPLTPMPVPLPSGITWPIFPGAGTGC